MIFKITAKAFTVFMILASLQTEISTVYAAEPESEQNDTISTVLKPVQREKTMIADDANTQISPDILKDIDLDSTAIKREEAEEKNSKKEKGTCFLL